MDTKKTVTGQCADILSELLGAAGDRLSRLLRLSRGRYVKQQPPSHSPMWFSLLGSESGKAYCDALSQGSVASRRERSQSECGGV